jgi:sRNA-binding carbon storage regulator CsrA
MLVVSRKENESIRIEPVEGLDPSLTLREAFANGPIVLTLAHVGLSRVRLIIEAPPALRIGRSPPRAREQEPPAANSAGADQAPRATTP